MDFIRESPMGFIRESSLGFIREVVLFPVNPPRRFGVGGPHPPSPRHIISFAFHLSISNLSDRSRTSHNRNSHPWTPSRRPSSTRFKTTPKPKSITTPLPIPPFPPFLKAFSLLSNPSPAFRLLSQTLRQSEKEGGAQKDRPVI